MAKHYYKGTLGDRVYFRASARLYRSIIDGHYGVGFSGTVANGIGVKDAPVEEITKAEFDRLNAIKIARLKAAGTHYVNPGHSWVFVSEAEEGAYSLIHDEEE